MFDVPSIQKKQIVAVTGLLLIIFVVAHLAGNLFIYGGPEALNGYAQQLHRMGPLVWVMRLGLLVVFLIHMAVTGSLVVANIRARGGLHRYALDKPVGERSWFTRLMPFTGAYLFFFIIWHIMDFTAIDQNGPRSFIGHTSFGVYGVIYNAFSDPLHALFYVIAMIFLGMHLAHGAESYFQTIGFNHPVITPVIRKVTKIISCLITLAFSSIPLYVFYLSL